MNEKTLEFEGRRAISHCLKNSVWKRLWTCYSPATILLTLNRNGPLDVIDDMNTYLLHGAESFLRS